MAFGRSAWTLKRFGALTCPVEVEVDVDDGKWKSRLWAGQQPGNSKPRGNTTKTSAVHLTRNEKPNIRPPISHSISLTHF